MIRVTPAGRVVDGLVADIGFSEEEIRHWAEAYCREQRSGDLETFIAWIDLREHQSSSRDHAGATPGAAMEHLPATVPVAAGLLVISAVVILEHARRLFKAMTMAEETQGLAAIAPLGQKVPAAVIEVFVGGGLLIAACALVRRSRLAMIFAASVQVIVALDALLRIVQATPSRPQSRCSCRRC